MSKESLFDALEICLQALDQGMDVESCLVRYPALADELRPILVAAVQARAASVADVPADVVRRGKARVLQAAAEMREQQSAAPVLPFWRKKGFLGARFYRLAVTTAVVIAFLLTGGTGLVNASSGALPGDRLYPVKRSWEGVQLAFVFNQQAKNELEHQFEHERVQEIEELYSEKRIEQVNFQGVVETQQNGTWRISGLNVASDEETIYSGTFAPGTIVQIVGETDDGIIQAKQIILVATPGVTPIVNPPSTAIPQILQTITPEAGEDSGSSETKKTEDSIQGIQEQSGGENKASFYPTGTPPHGQDNSSQTDGPGGDSEQPSTDDSGGGDD